MIVATIVVSRARFAGNASSGGGGSSGPRVAGATSVFWWARTAARRTNSSLDGTPANSDAVDLAGDQLEHELAPIEVPVDGEPASEFEQREPEQAGRPLGGGGAVVVAEIHRVAGLAEQVVEPVAVLGRDRAPHPIGALGDLGRRVVHLGVHDPGEHQIGTLAEGDAVEVVPREQHAAAVPEVVVDHRVDLRRDRPELFERGRPSTRRLDQRTDPAQLAGRSAGRRRRAFQQRQRLAGRHPPAQRFVQVLTEGPEIVAVQPEVVLPVREAVLDASVDVVEHPGIVERGEVDVLQRQVGGDDRRLAAVMPVVDHLLPRLLDEHSSGTGVAPTHLGMEPHREGDHEPRRRAVGGCVGPEQRPEA